MNISLNELHVILKAADQGKAAAVKNQTVNPYEDGTVAFLAWHMAWNMQTNPGVRPF